MSAPIGLTLRDAVKQVIKEAEEAEKELPQLNEAGEYPPGVIPPNIRYRPPFLKVPLHDTRGDARQIVYDNVHNRGLCPEFAHAIAYAFVDFYADVLHTNVQLFKEGDYHPLDNTMTWCKSIDKLSDVFLHKIAAGEVVSPVDPVGWKLWCSSSHAERNGRSKQEDRHIAMHDFDLFRNKVSTYAAAHFTPEFLKAGARVDSDCLKEAFRLLDKRLTLRCEREKWHSGSTAVVAALNDDKMAFAWVGDSAAILLRRGGKASRVTTEHSPADLKEAARVEQEGGYIVFVQGEMRVNGVLNITRSLGDINGRPMISSIPDTLEMERSHEDIGLLIACDGVADELEDQHVYALVREFAQTRPLDDWPSIAKHICQRAKDVGSLDNLTALFVFLKPPEKVWEYFKEGDGEDAIPALSAPVPPQTYDLEGFVRSFQINRSSLRARDVHVGCSRTQTRLKSGLE